MSKKAFSLIELSIVILIVGILIAGITQSSRLVRQFKISSARSLTKSSPVHGIRNLVSWYEPTLEESFDATIDANSSTGNRVVNWYDVATGSIVKNNARQISSSSQPIYVLDGINGLPSVRFSSSSSQFLNLPNGTVPYDDSPYTIFFVSKLVGTTCFCGLLGSGSYLQDNRVNAFRYGTGGVLVNYWWGFDLETSTNLVSGNVPYVITFYYNKSLRRIFTNGSQIASSASSANRATDVNNTIGLTFNNEYFNGDIGEIIIFDRALTNEERVSIETYLSKKWSIDIS